MEEKTKGILRSILALEALEQDTGSSKLHSEITATAIAMLRRPLVSENMKKKIHQHQRKMCLKSRQIEWSFAP